MENEVLLDKARELSRLVFELIRTMQSNLSDPSTRSLCLLLKQMVLMRRKFNNNVDDIIIGVSSYVPSRQNDIHVQNVVSAATMRRRGNMSRLNNGRVSRMSVPDRYRYSPRPRTRRNPSYDPDRLRSSAHNLSVPTRSGLLIPETAVRSVPNIASQRASDTLTGQSSSNHTDLNNYNSTQFPLGTQLNVGRCAICLEGLIAGNVLVTPCGHVFCRECISVWIKRFKTCPNCRKRLSGVKKLVKLYLS